MHEIRKNIPTRVIDVSSVETDANGNKYTFDGHVEYRHYDYLYFILKVSNGLTRIGQNYFKSR